MSTSSADYAQSRMSTSSTDGRQRAVDLQIYHKTWEAAIELVEEILEVLKENKGGSPWSQEAKCCEKG